MFTSHLFLFFFRNFAPQAAILPALEGWTGVPNAGAESWAQVNSSGESWSTVSKQTNIWVTVTDPS